MPEQFELSETTSTNDQRIRGLLAQINLTQERISKQEGWISFLSLLSFVLFLLFVQCFFFVAMIPVRYNPIYPLVLFCPSVVGLFYTLGNHKRTGKIFTGKMEELVTCRDLSAVAPLLEYAIVHSSSRLGRLALSALTTLLPHLKASDAGLLTSSHRRTLNNILRHNGTLSASSDIPIEFVLAALKALEQIGDAEALPAVEQLASCHAKNHRQEQIKQAAQECLPYLHANAGLVSQQQTLLRPSNAENATPDTLLRPASIGAQTPSDELLRSSQENAEAK